MLGADQLFMKTLCQSVCLCQNLLCPRGIILLILQSYGTVKGNQILYDVHNLFFIYAVLKKHLGCHAVALFQKTYQDMLGTHIALLQFSCRFFCM